VALASEKDLGVGVDEWQRSMLNRLGLVVMQSSKTVGLRALGVVDGGDGGAV
jgi:hypothetical protein